MIPSAKYQVSSQVGKVRKGYIPCRINIDVKIKPDVLSAYCFRELPDKVYDLVLLAAAIAYADRTLTRRPSIAWKREIELISLAADPDFWNRPCIRKKLCDSLALLTGDEWKITFNKRSWTLPKKIQPLLPLEHQVSGIIPYSGGLDSRALAQIRLSKGENLILVTAGNKKNADKEWQEKSHGRRRQISVPIHIAQKGASKRLREQSYRSRGFIFGVMGGIAAYLSDCPTILMPENGQGTLGLWLSPVGNEALDVRNHPQFTHKLSEIFKEVFNFDLNYEFPSLWKTKGEVLVDLKNLEDSLWFKAKSCARDGRSVGKKQCGVCSACLLRRQSLLRAGLDEKMDSYFWSNLSAQELDHARACTSLRLSNDNDWKYAVCGALSMTQLARVYKDQEMIHYKSKILAPFVNLSVEETKIRIERLLKAHREEWQNFVEHQGKNSFLYGIVNQDDK